MGIKKIIRSKGGKLAALGVAAGLLLGGAAIAHEDVDINQIAEPTPIVQILDQAPAPDIVMDDDDEDETQEEKKRSGWWNLVSAPAYAVGWVLTKLLGLLWKAVLSPVANKIVFWLLIALVALAAVAIGLKAAFPDVPLKEILTGKRCMGVIAGVFAACAVCFILSRTWPDYEKYAEILRAILGYTAAIFSAFIIWRRHSLKKEKAEAAQA